ncbi:MAG: hypothetical protein NC346_09040 [Prevotella sp.]|nr:hypothetical protein [Prevotella sp.]MCM1443667.1 hypothetical protein [Muribaculum sp.]MCM1577150.1 hypothetical protein [Bacteroides sp.]
MDWQTFLTIILGSGNVVQLVTLLVMRKKTKAETESVAIKNMELVIKNMQDEIIRLQNRNTELEKQVAELHTIVNKIHI